MTRLTSFFTFIVLLLTSVFSYAQTLDEEVGFIYVKAEYLYETGRYEDAIVQFNQVITKNPKYKEALIHRGWSKYNLAAYKGAALDAIQFIDLNGITGNASALLGRSQAMLNDRDAAINSLSAAVALADENSEYREWRAELYEKKGDLIKACIDYEEAMKLGSKSAMVKAKSLCGVTASTNTNGPKRTVPVVPVPQNSNTSGTNTSTPDNADSDEDTRAETTTSTNTNSNSESTKIPDNTVPVGGGISNDSMIIDDSEPVVRDEKIPLDDNTVKTIEIDDDLSIDIYGQELGLREIKETPNILILNDQNGTVMIHICVDKAGVVTKAEFNPDFSTLSKKSIVSLAIRKAKEFEFAPGKYDSQCGVMVFKVKGS